jgi:hypothetical protein
MAQPSAAGASSPAPNYAEQMLGDVHEQISVDRAILAVARQRRNAITATARRFPGALRVFSSGSVAHGTVIFEVEDADGGVVLDRRSYQELGPDGHDVGPSAIVREMALFIYDELKADFPGLKYEMPGKRSIKFTFSDPVKGQDPYVDLIVALTRAEGEGIWIPRLSDNSWDASDPEEHTRLLTSESIVKDLRVHRAQTIRLIKACIKQDDYPVLSSFHIEARVLADVEKVRTVGESLERVFSKTAQALELGDTPDPAGVSDPIKLEVPRDRAVRRLRGLAESMAEALQHSGDKRRAQTALNRVFPEFIDPPDSGGKGAIAAGLRGGPPSGAAATAFGPSTAGAKSFRSSGDAAA